MSKALLSIDFGTTQIKSGCWLPDERLESLPFPDGQTYLPSLVTVLGKGEFAFGQEAEDSKEIFPTFTNLKRHLISETNILGYYDDGSPITTDEIAKAFFTHIRDCFIASGRAQKENQVDVVLSVPDSWNDHNRGKLIAVVENAGFKVIGMHNETTAGLAFVLQELKGQRLSVLIFDLGGGTSDASLAVADGHNTTEVLWHLGERELGGVDLDLNLAESLSKAIQDKLGINVEDQPILWNKLIAEAERIKKRLSTRQKAKLLLEIEGNTIDQELDREKFESINESIFARFEKMVKEAKENSAGQNIDVICLSGFTSLYPKFQEIVQSIFPDTKIMAPSDRGHAVAKGLALLGPNMKGTLPPQRGADMLQPIVEEVSSQDLSVIFLQDEPDGTKGYARVLIPKNTPLSECRATKPANMPFPNAKDALVTITEAAEGTPQEACEYIDSWGFTVEKSTQEHYANNDAPDRFEIVASINADSLVEIVVTDLFEKQSHTFTHANRKYF